MFTDRSTRRGFAGRLAALLPGLGFAGMAGRAPAPSRNSMAMESLPAKVSSRRLSFTMV